MKTLRAYAELVRLPNVFTSLADVLAGYWLVSHSLHWSAALSWLLSASACFYSAGIVFNDLHDLETDRRERPARPLPSGRITMRAAWTLAIVLSVTGLAAAGAASLHADGATGWAPFRPIITAILLLMAVLAYDFALKDTILGPLNMGTCRSLNLLLGASAGPGVVSGEAPPALAYLAIAVLLYVTSVTLLAQGEVGGLARWRIMLGIAGIAAAILLIGAVCVAERLLDDFTWILWLAVAIHLGRVSLRMVRSPSSPVVLYAIKTYIFAIIALDALMASAAQGWEAGAIVLCLLVPALLLGRWVYST